MIDCNERPRHPPAPTRVTFDALYRLLAYLLGAA